MPFGSSDPDPESDVMALISLRTCRLACIQCWLCDRGRTEMETMAAMLDHFAAPIVPPAIGSRNPSTKV